MRRFAILRSVQTPASISSSTLMTIFRHSRSTVRVLIGTCRYCIGWCSSALSSGSAPTSHGQHELARHGRLRRCSNGKSLSCGGVHDRRRKLQLAKPLRCRPRQIPAWDCFPWMYPIDGATQPFSALQGHGRCAPRTNRHWSRAKSVCALRSIRPESRTRVAEMTEVIATDASNRNR